MPKLSPEEIKIAQEWLKDHRSLGSVARDYSVVDPYHTLPHHSPNTQTPPTSKASASSTATVFQKTVDGMGSNHIKSEELLDDTPHSSATSTPAASTKRNPPRKARENSSDWDASDSEELYLDSSEDDRNVDEDNDFISGPPKRRPSRLKKLAGQRKPPISNRKPGTATESAAPTGDRVQRKSPTGKSDQPWTQAEHNALLKIWKEVDAEFSSESRGKGFNEKKWQMVETRLFAHRFTKYKRGFNSLRLHWSRSGARYIVDERMRKDPTKLIAGVEHDRNRKRKEKNEQIAAGANAFELDRRRKRAKKER
ncbi:hypothetical protein MMC25_000073 [Agyrium rufum]|nr:hypothetical protein [Agyrium rufum]